MSKYKLIIEDGYDNTYIHPDARFVKTVDGEDYYSMRPLGFPNYMMSRSGRIFHIESHNERFFQLIKKPKNRLKMILKYSGTEKSFNSGNIIATMFIPNPDQKDKVFYKDKNPLNNNLSNLEWRDYYKQY